MDLDLPYKAEYAKSSRSSCRGCKKSISQDSLRLAIMIQSPKFDSKMAQWYHFKCFFDKQRPKTVDDIQDFEKLRVSDQEQIKFKVGVTADIIVPDKKGKKRAAPSEAAAKKSALKDFIIEYAKSGRAMCRGCEQKILKDEIRISKKDFESEVGRKYGGQDMWHHVTCFAQLRAEIGYFESADKLPGFKKLKTTDQQEVNAQLPAIKQEDIPAEKKIKKEEVDPAEHAKNKEYQEQIKIMYKYRDGLKASLKKSDWHELIRYNNQRPLPGEQALDQLSDMMTFGAFAPCKECKSTQFVHSKVGYVCTGDLTEWTKCNFTTKEPTRVPFKLPKNFVKDYAFLKKYVYIPRTRIFKDVNPTKTNDVKMEDEPDGKPKVTRKLPPLYDMEFVILSRPTRGKEELKREIVSMGGKVTTRIGPNVMAVFASADLVEKMGARISEAEVHQVHVVSEDFVDEAKDYTGKIPELVVKKSICNWGSDPSTRLPPEPSTSSKSKSRGSHYTKSVPSKVTLQLKGGSAVDPDSELQDVAHVYQNGDNKFSVVLGLTDIQKQKNSYYKLQLLESDISGHNRCYWLFRSWGRIGTTIGDKKIEKYSSVHDAESAFAGIYSDKTANDWNMRHRFKKIPGKMYPIDVDYGEEPDKMDIVESESKLHPSVQTLVKMIFDVNSMKQLMLEFELDAEKMPLGKLSKSQIQNAYKVLSELQTLIDTGGSRSKFIDACNRFYTFVPHSFGVDNAPIINSAEVVKQKIDMLDSLMELEIAYNLMKSSGSNHTVDKYYEKLDTEIEVLDRKSEEFAIIEEYVQNTHAATHSSYSLEIVEVYSVKRNGEEKRFKPFKKLHNRRLLWHGSRVTNFAGILSQGLRIAPPEAPVTGYMFGKGIYFADMVSKSANYCCTSVGNPNGLLLLCDVALGDMYERENAEYVEKLPKGKHSTKGVGTTEPDPKAYKELNGIQVPVGKGVSRGTYSSLLYNEYIVYDVAQVNVKYLLNLKFNYKY